MTYEAMAREMTEGHPTGDLCPGCDCETVISTRGSFLLLDCDCGTVLAMASDLPSAA